MARQKLSEPPSPHAADSLTVDLDRGVWVVTLLGEHDISTVPGFGPTAERLIEAEQSAVCRPTRLVVDLSRVEFIDSSVLNGLITAHKMLEHDPDADLAIVVDSPDCFAAHLVKLAGMTQVIPTFTSRDAAITALCPENRL